jgi:hypothetical protein
LLPVLDHSCVHEPAVGEPAEADFSVQILVKPADEVGLRLSPTKAAVTEKETIVQGPPTGRDEAIIITWLKLGLAFEGFKSGALMNRYRKIFQSSAGVAAALATPPLGTLLRAFRLESVIYPCPGSSSNPDTKKAAKCSGWCNDPSERSRTFHATGNNEPARRHANHAGAITLVHRAGDFPSLESAVMTLF